MKTFIAKNYCLHLILLITFTIPARSSDGAEQMLTLKHQQIDNPIVIDDFFQYAPIVSVYALNLAGLKGEHSFLDRTLIIGASYVLMGSTVYGLKQTTGVQRPDGSSFDSFPSGHSAIVFMGAEYLRREYWHISPWYGIAGYSLATVTGILRVYRNEHRPMEVFAGAGIGVLSTSLVYLLYPHVMGRVFPNHEIKRSSKTLATPFFREDAAGIALIFSF